MKIREITFDRAPGGDIDGVIVYLEDMIDTPTHEFGRHELRAEFTLPITPEIDQWVMLTLGVIGTEIRKHASAPLK